MTFSSFDVQPIEQTSDASLPLESPESQEETSEDESEDTDWSEGSGQISHNRYIIFLNYESKFVTIISL